MTLCVLGVVDFEETRGLRVRRQMGNGEPDKGRAA
jgi:hypothetical protein